MSARYTLRETAEHEAKKIDGLTKKMDGSEGARYGYKGMDIEGELEPGGLQKCLAG